MTRHRSTWGATARVARGIGALLALGVLLAGVPLALSRFGNVADLLAVDWAAALTGVGGGLLMMALLSAAGWAAWLALAAATVAEVVALASRRRVSVTLPGTGWLRPVVSALVLAAVGAPGATLADASAQPHLPAPPPRPLTAAGPGPGAGFAAAAARAPAGSAAAPSASTILLPAAGRAPRSPSQAAKVELRVVVREGESLWVIAERELGDPERWPEIYELNRDQIADPDLIDVGWALRLPPPSSAPAPEGPRSASAPDAGTAPLPSDAAEEPPSSAQPGAGAGRARRRPPRSRRARGPTR